MLSPWKKSLFSNGIVLFLKKSSAIWLPQGELWATDKEHSFKNYSKGKKMVMMIMIRLIEIKSSIEQLRCYHHGKKVYSQLNKAKRKTIENV